MRRFSVRLTWSHLVISLALLLSAVGVAHADTVSSPVALVGQQITAQKCFYVKSTRVKPAPGGQNIQYKSTIYKRQRNATTGCSINHAAVNFLTGESDFAAILYRTSDFWICSETGFFIPPNNVPSWTVSRAYNRTGTCANTTHFTVASNGNAFAGNAYEAAYLGFGYP